MTGRDDRAFAPGGEFVPSRGTLLAPAFTVVRDHYDRTPGWRGWLDLVLRRKPIRVIDEVRWS